MRARIVPLERPPSLTALVVEAVREGIIGGRLAFGQQLSELQIAEELQVSRTPVREAFLALKAQGLVEIRPQRGTFVFRLDRAGFAALAAMREILECGALRVAIERDHAGLEAALAANIAAMAGLDPADIERGVRLDTDFHDRLFRAADNTYLSEAYAIIAGKVEAIRQRWQTRHGSIHNFLSDHRRILDAVRSDDLERAHALMTAHLRRAAAAYAAIIDA